MSARWIDMIRFTLADIVARGEWDDFGLFRIINRISFVCKNHLIFVFVFKRDLGAIDSNNGSAVSRVSYKASPLISSLDPEFFDLTFNHLLEKNIINEGLTYDKFVKLIKEKQYNLSERVINQAAFDDYAIQIWGSSEFVLVMELDVKPGKVGTKPPLELKTIPRSSELGAFIAEVLKPFDGIESAAEEYPNIYSSHMLLSKESTERGLANLRGANKFEPASDDDPKPLTDKERIFITSLVKDIELLVEQEYKRLSKSPLINKNYSNLGTKEYFSTPNMTFISKIFSSEELRYGNYKYSSQVVIPDTQEDCINKALKQADSGDYIAFDKGVFDKQFWQWAKNERGRQRILELARRPMPSSVRLFAESVLMSGTTLIKPKVFTRKAIGWIAKQASPSKRMDALNQLGCLHFLLQLGSPVRPVEAKELSLVALPFRCSGGIWMCAVYVRENTTGEVEGVIDHEQFEENTLIYHSLFRESERRLRRKARANYTDALGKLMARAIVETRKRHEDKATLCLDAVACDRFANNVRLLTRVYPFDRLEPVFPAEDDAILPFTKIGFQNKPNDYFDRLTLHEFVRMEDNVKRLHERILLASVTEDDESDD